MRYQLMVKHQEGSNTVNMLGTCDEKGFCQLYELVNQALKYAERMKTTCERMETPTSITVDLHFVSKKSAMTFLERLPRHKQ